jgi:hypothetical protein
LLERSDEVWPLSHGGELVFGGVAGAKIDELVKIGFHVARNYSFFSYLVCFRSGALGGELRYLLRVLVSI